MKPTQRSSTSKSPRRLRSFSTGLPRTWSPFHSVMLSLYLFWTRVSYTFPTGRHKHEIREVESGVEKKRFLTRPTTRRLEAKCVERSDMFRLIRGRSGGETKNASCFLKCRTAEALANRNDRVALVTLSCCRVSTTYSSAAISDVVSQREAGW